MVLFSAFYIFLLFVFCRILFFCFSETIPVCGALILFGFFFGIGFSFLYVSFVLLPMNIRLRFTFMWCHKTIIFFFRSFLKQKLNYKEYNNNNYLVHSKNKRETEQKFWITISVAWENRRDSDENIKSESNKLMYKSTKGEKRTQSKFYTH